MISDIKDLKQLIKFLRANGIEEFSQGDLRIKFDGSKPTQVRHTPKGKSTPDIFGEITEDTRIQTPDALTEEQLLFWSSGDGTPS